MEYVWVLHEFKPQEADELPLKAGDRVAVIEKDDVYQDGWWKGTNPDGKTGLFPRSYTTDKPPATQTPSTADRSGVAFPNSGAAPTTPTKVAEESTPTNGSHTNGSKEERTRNFSHGEITMQATITDVQRAIEQLGGDDNDGNRSFSFRSLNDEYSERSDTGTDGETSDVDDGTDFHRNAREKLALRAKVENEQRMKESGSVPSTPLRITQPPIDVELSDESDDEGDDLKVLDALKNQRRHSEGAPDSKFATRYSYIPEEDEAEVAEASRLPSGRPSLDDRNATLGSSLPSARPTIPTFSHSIPSPDSDNGYIVPSEDYIVPSPGVNQDDLPTATADRLTFNVPLVASPEPSPSLSTHTQSTEPSPIPPPAPPPVSVVMPPPAAPAPLPIAAPAPLPAALASPMSFRTTTPVATPPASVTSFSHRRVASSSSAAFSMRSASLSASPAPTTVVDTVMPGTLNPLTPPTPENESTPVLPAASAPSILSLGTAVSSAPSTVKLAPIPIRTNEALPPAVRSGAPSPGLPLPSPSVSSSGSFATSSASKHQSLTPATTPMSFKGPAYSTPSHETSPLSTQEGGKKSPTTHPSEWALEEVVDWLMSKGFDQAVCERFMEQEITGDVLLELNPNILKDEIGILKWGQRQRIMNAITELRRPRSFVEYERPPMPNIATSRTQSLNYGHSHTSSIQSSAQQSYNNSPLGYAGPGFSPPPAAAQTMPMASTNVAPGSYGSFSSADASIYQMSFPEPPMSAASMPMPQSGWRPFEAVGVPPQSEATLNNGRVFEPVPEGVRMPVGAAPLVGLGLNAPPSPSSSRPQSPGASPSSTKPSKSRPSNLTVSASDQHLNVTAIGEEDQAAASGDEDRGAMSEPDGQDHKSKRRRLFGRSAESASIKEKATSLKEIKESGSSRHSKESSRVTLNDGSSKLSAGDEAAPVRRHSKKKSGDDRGKGDRLSLFGGSIGGAIAKKARKPVPRLSSGGLSERSEKDKEKEKERERKEKEKKEKEKEKEKVVKTLHGDKPEKAEKGEKAEKSEHDWTSLATFTRMRHHSERRASGRPSTADGAFKREKIGQSLSPKDRPKDPALLRKRTSSMSDSVSSPPPSGVVKPGKSILQQIGTPDHNGWMRKKSDHYNSWKLRYFVLKGSHLYCLKSNDKSETKIKGYINIVGYKVIADENIDPGRYGFRIVHESDKTHYFSHDEQIVIREWMKALMKATITRDFANPVASSSNIPTIPLAVAQAMNPSPRPPSPSARAATQRAHRRDNPNQLSSRDAQILLMAMPQKSPSLSSPSLNGSFQDGERARVESFFTSNSVPNKMAEPASPRRPITPKAPVPPRPSREMRRKVTSPSPEDNAVLDDSLIDWANSHLPEGLQITDPTGSLGGGLTLLRIAENIKGTPSSPPVADSAFPSGPNDDKLDGLFALFDFLLENDVKMGAVSINDIRQGKKQKVVQILQALRTWEQKRNSISTSIAQGSLAGAGYMSGPLQFF